MVTRLFLVVILSREMPLFGDEITSRRHFWSETPFFGDKTLSRRHFLVGNSIFWRRDHFSSSFLCGKVHFLATKPFLVVIFVRETPFFGDETFSRRHFLVGNSFFWRRDHFSSSFLCGKVHFLATKPFLVVIFVRETPLFGDETFSRRHFCTGNSTFWRRDHFSSSFLREKLHFLVTRPLLVVIFSREMPLFGDEITSRRHFCAGNSIFW
ncbi:hypothetical protein NST54_16440 [Caldifermentibacillus hisashii]|uniref:hypothetical protein n=1 Tax=Caldifermentibacillus hisashii TaxID=996558 RepID=UPI0034D60392